MNAGSMIADSARAFLTKIGGTARARKLRDSSTAFDRNAWNEMAQLGWFGLLIGEESGGLGLGGRELADLMEQLGAHLAGEPVAEAIAAGAVIAAADPKHTILADIVAGTVIPVPVEGEFRAVNGRITGASTPAANLSGATHLLLATAGEGERLALVPLSTPGIARKTHATVDGGTMDLVTLDVRLGDAITLPLRNAPQNRAGDLHRLAYAAYLAGLADAAFTIALDYLRTRKQFGVPIGTFQALQHRAATVYVRIASVRALVSEVCAALETEKLPAASAAAAFSAAEMALAVAKECIQFHGAIGFADEHQIGLFLKRALGVAGAIGTGDECLDRYSGASRNLNDTNNISTAA